MVQQLKKTLNDIKWTQAQIDDSSLVGPAFLVQTQTRLES